MSYCISNKTFCCITGHCVVVAAAYHTHRDMNVTITSDRYCVILPLVSAFLPSLEESALLASSLLINRRTAVDAILNHNNNTNGNITFNTIPDNVRDRLSFDDIISILKWFGMWFNLKERNSTAEELVVRTENFHAFLILCKNGC